MANGKDNNYLLKAKASIVESSKDFMGIADKVGNLVYLNDAAYKLMGYNDNERPKFKTIAEIHANDFDKFALEVIQPSVFKDGSWSGIGYLRHKDGSAFEVFQTVFPIFGEDKKAYGTAAVMKDMSEVIRQKAELDQTNERFKKVLDTAKIGIVLINMETNTIELVNKYTEELLMLSADEVVGRKCYEVLCRNSPDLCPHVNEKSTPTIVAERILKRPDGSEVPIIKTGTWITIDGHEYLVDTFVDISIQKELENSLFDAKIAAEAANRSKSEFLSHMSHEMRTPLNAVIGMAQVAGKYNDVQKLKDSINTIETSAMHLLGLINDVLDLSKIEEHKMELCVEPFSLKKMVNKIVAVIEPKTTEKNISFVVNIDEEIPEMLNGDSMRISQVLLNFLSNSAKFTPDGGKITFEVLARSKAQGFYTIVFKVTDTGIGMTPDQLKRLFNPFEQADNSTYRKFGGTGLGMAISKRIVNMMSSDILVHSEYGKGSAFEFELKLEKRGNDMENYAEEEITDISGIFKGKRLLVADDVDINRTIVIELLAETDIQIDEAADGNEAVEKFIENGYDIILMDVQMPHLDGYEATKAIRDSGAKGREVIIVAMSANVFQEDVERSVSEGMNAHLGKPIDMDSMIKTMKRLLYPEVKAETAEKKEVYALVDNYLEIANGDGIIDIVEALANAKSEEKLARRIEIFLKGNFNEKIHMAVAASDYMIAQQLAEEMHERAKQLALLSVTAYSGNVEACLSRGEYSHAAMYLADLDGAASKSLALLKKLIEKK